MSGGGPDSSPPFSSGGDFLLNLLKNPPQKFHHQPPQQHHLPDPAVAAVGPAVPYPYPPTGGGVHQQPPPPWSPHGFFNQNSFTNPNPGENQNPGSSLNFMHSLPIRRSSGEDLGRINWGLGGDLHQSSQQQHKLVFGSVFSETRTAPSGGDPGRNLERIEGFRENEREINDFGRYPRVNSRGFVERGGSSRPNLEKDEVFRGNERETLDFDMNPRVNSRGFVERGGSSRLDLEKVEVFRGNERESLDFGRNPRVNSLGFVERGGASRPPPGFSGNARGEVRNRSDFGHNVGMSGVSDRFSQYSSSSSNGSEGGRDNGRGVRDQRENLGPQRAGSSLNSVSVNDIGTSRVESYSEDAVNGETSRKHEPDDEDWDDIEERVMNVLTLEDELDEKSEIKNHPVLRTKDYRSDKRGDWILNQRMRNYKRQTTCRNDINRLNVQFLATYESLIPLEEEKVKQKQLLSLLEKCVSTEWPEARLYLYGSCANSFGFTKSDIDVCLALGDAYNSKSEVLLKLADILETQNLENVQALTRARVPIVKFMDAATGISCDICVDNMLAVVNTKLLRDYAKIDVRLRQLTFIIKHWAKSRGVNETYRGTLSSYAYVLMCIHFLQLRRPPILPCLQGMEPTFSVTVDGVNCAYFDQVEKLDGFGSHNRESIAQLVWGFFHYWAYCHDYTCDVISIRMGSTLRKYEKDWTKRIGNDRHLICIEDPFEVSHDLGRVVDKRSIRVLREEFERAAEIMQYDPNPCVKLFEPYIPD